jgi:anti-anti-sigma factor
MKEGPVADEPVYAGGTPPGDVVTDGEPRASFADLGDVEVVPNGATTVVRLRGEVDLSLSDVLAHAYEQCVAQARPVRLDMSALSFIDSTGIGFVARLAAVEQTAGRRLAIVGASRRTSETLSLTGLDDLLDLDQPS